jgi:hypothetical protein
MLRLQQGNLALAQAEMFDPPVARVGDALTFIGGYCNDGIRRDNSQERL